MSEDHSKKSKEPQNKLRNSSLKIIAEKFFPEASQIKLKMPRHRKKQQTNQEKFDHMLQHAEMFAKDHKLEEVGIRQVGEYKEIDRIDVTPDTPDCVEEKDQIRSKRRLAGICRRKNNKNSGSSTDKLKEFEKAVNEQNFDQETLYRSYIKYAEEKNATSIFDAKNKTKNQIKVKKEFNTHKAIDPLFGIKSINDSSFIKSYQQKWGIPYNDFTPRIKDHPTIDSHSTLSKTDQHKVNKILDRNIFRYYEYAKAELAATASLQTESIPMCTVTGFSTQNGSLPQLNSLLMVGDSTESLLDLRTQSLIMQAQPKTASLNTRARRRENSLVNFSRTNNFSKQIEQSTVAASENPDNARSISISARRQIDSKPLPDLFCDHRQEMQAIKDSLDDQRCQLQTFKKSRRIRFLMSKLKQI